MTLQQLGTCLGEKEAAHRLGISRVTLLRARRRGEISHFRFGARVVYAESHLSEFLTRKEHRGNGQPTAAAA
jgi:excisionase family DNA binding protein